MTMIGHQGVLAAVAGGITKGKTIFGSGFATVGVEDFVVWHSLKSSGTGTMTPARIGLQIEYLSG